MSAILKVVREMCELIAIPSVASSFLMLLFLYFLTNYYASCYDNCGLTRFTNNPSSLNYSVHARQVGISKLNGLIIMKYEYLLCTVGQLWLVVDAFLSHLNFNAQVDIAEPV